MIGYTKEDFKFEKDYIVRVECKECGYWTEDDDEFNSNCPECGGDFMDETSHEGCRCIICDCYIDMWDDVYRHNERLEVLICKDCYENLEDE